MRVTPIGTHNTKRYDLFLESGQRFMARAVGGELVLYRPRGKVSEYNDPRRPSQVNVVGDEWAALVRLLTGWWQTEDIELVNHGAVQEEFELRDRDGATLIRNTPGLSKRVQDKLMGDGLKSLGDVRRYLALGADPSYSRAIITEIENAMVYLVD